MAGLKAEASLTQALMPSWAAGNGRSENRNHIQILSLVKSICVLIHMKYGHHCLNLSSGFTVIFAWYTDYNDFYIKNGSYKSKILRMFIFKNL